MSTTTAVLIGVSLLLLMVLGGGAIAMMMLLNTPKRPTPNPPQQPASPPPPPPPPPPISIEDAAHEALTVIKSYGSRKAAQTIGQRLADYETEQIVNAIATGVQAPPKA